MGFLIDRTIAFFIANFPSWQDIPVGGSLGVLWSYLCLRFAGYLKLGRGCQTAYSRKAFHFLVFGSVVIIQMIWDTPMVCLFGGGCTLVIFYALYKGPGNVLYEAMAREKDEPHRTYYIVVPYVTTLVGGLVSNILFGRLAMVGYLVAGFGDAMGEPVGTRFGKHTYRVPSLASVKAIRSWEGSLAVFTASVVAIAISICLLPDLTFTGGSVVLVLMLALVSATVEAISPHGWDNATMQICPPFLTWLVL